MKSLRIDKISILPCLTYSVSIESQTSLLDETHMDDITNEPIAHSHISPVSRWPRVLIHNQLYATLTPNSFTYTSAWGHSNPSNLISNWSLGEKPLISSSTTLFETNHRYLGSNSCRNPAPDTTLARATLILGGSHIYTKRHVGLFRIRILFQFPCCTKAYSVFRIIPRSTVCFCFRVIQRSTRLGRLASQKPAGPSLLHRNDKITRKCTLAGPSLKAASQPFNILSGPMDHIPFSVWPRWHTPYPVCKVTYAVSFC
jgi:hypothetical protein